MSSHTMSSPPQLAVYELTFFSLKSFAKRHAQLLPSPAQLLPCLRLQKIRKMFSTLNTPHAQYF